MKFFQALWNVWNWQDVAARFDQVQRVDLSIANAAEGVPSSQAHLAH
ncbi:MAG TPA: hypothetical protein VKE49_04755 [Myxococcaceae bacterium]|nr:hypothetical protein [Myxococcaceae bacterium]